MSTMICDKPKHQEGGSGIYISRYCGPTGHDRLRVDIWISGEWHTLDRKTWVEIRDAIDAGFAEFPA